MADLCLAYIAVLHNIALYACTTVCIASLCVEGLSREDGLHLLFALAPSHIVMYVHCPK